MNWPSFWFGWVGGTAIGMFAGLGIAWWIVRYETNAVLKEEARRRRGLWIVAKREAANG